MLTAAQVAASGLATVGAPAVSSCLLLSESAPSLSCLVCSDIAQLRDRLRLLDICIVRFLASGWATGALPAADIVRDGGLLGISVDEGRRWLPRHSRMPYRLIALSSAEHDTLRQHLRDGRAWDAFKTVQLLYLAEPGFSGARDAIHAPAAYAADARPDRDYLVLPVR
ncbi:MAG: hypothetical protein RMM29_08895 [Planctomycetota bacterium]|nr:hypothetical protein [Planctomycetota bacterium]MCX8040367.1 hypothetical protein [Planctomycetota bacterium]MDW8373743.1 hypothetical protein [Planctomycetota bacterium]